MAKWLVSRGGALEDESVTADTCRVLDSGALVFSNRLKVPVEGSWERPLVHVFAPGRWVEVVSVEEQEPPATNLDDVCTCGNACCHGLRKHDHPAGGAHQFYRELQS